MTLSEFENVLKTTGIPVTYYAFPEEEAPQLPFICWVITGCDNFAADGVAYVINNQVVVELYTIIRDIQVEERVESTLSSFYWNKETTFLEDEKCWEVIYTIGGYFTNG